MAQPVATPKAERFDTDYFQTPLRYFAQLRSSRPVTPVVFPDGSQSWLLTKYGDVRSALADPRLSTDVRKLPPDRWGGDPGYGDLRHHMLNLDHPEHTRLRRLAAKAFTLPRIAALRPRIMEITRALAEAMAGQDETDLLESFAFPLPVTVICELLGIPTADREVFGATSQVILSSAVSPDEFRSARADMHGYVTELLSRKRSQPSEDLLSALITARDDEVASLDEAELIAMVFLLLITGHETVVNLIGNGMLALLENPAELMRLQDEPDLLPSAIDELVRYAGPLNHATRRFTLTEISVGGVRIPPWQWVLCATSAANRDEHAFPDPDRLNVSRDTTGHLGFGHGIHHCLGMSLARLEGEVAISTLLTRFPAMSLAIPAEKLRWRQSSLIHGLEALPVRLR
jgi:cytochrome P450